MASFTITIDDAAQLAGISAARATYNESLSPVLSETGEIIGLNPNRIETDAEYVQFVMYRAAESYRKQYDL